MSRLFSKFYKLFEGVLCLILENITRLCKQRGVSIARLEKETGLGNGTVARWGESSPRVENLQKVADYFGVPLSDLLSAENSQNTE